MTDWSRLRDAYGPASEIPKLLDRLSPDPKDGAWNDLWSRLCHQGTVYSASFAALPRLLEIASGWEPRQRPMIVSLAAAIVSAETVVGDRDALMRDLAPTVASLEMIAREALQAPGLSATDFLESAQAVLAFQGDRLWGRQLNGLSSGEFEGRCPACHARLYLVIGQYGFFTTAEEWVKRPEARRWPVRPADPATLAGAGLWLHEAAQAAHQADVALWARHLFGSMQCPACDRPARVTDAIMPA